MKEEIEYDGEIYDYANEYLNIYLDLKKNYYDTVRNEQLEENPFLDSIILKDLDNDDVPEMILSIN